MGAVRESKLSCSSPMLFVPKDHGTGLRQCIDYRAINKITVPNRYPLPNMDVLNEIVQVAKYFNKIDHKNGYHLIQIKEGHKWRTAFCCRYGLFEYTVMPFRLCNAQITFQSMINHIFRDTHDQGMSASRTILSSGPQCSKDCTNRPLRCCNSYNTTGCASHRTGASGYNTKSNSLDTWFLNKVSK